MAIDLFLGSAIAKFHAQKSMAERAIGQLDFEQLRTPLDANTNSIVVIMKHMAGNMRSRWTDLLSSDGEKPWRHRDQEFIDDFTTRQAVETNWNEGWACVFEAMGKLTADDLAREICIRGVAHTVTDAIIRQLDHYAYHVGQIVLIARIHAKDNWETLTIARGESEQYNRRTWGQSG
jgi:hypothetical protein